MILLASVGIGLSLIRERQKQLRALREVCDALSLLRFELGTNRAPLAQLLSVTAQRSEGCAAAFLLAVMESLSSLGERSFSRLWEEAALRTLPDLPKDELRELIAAGRALGRFELQEQLDALSGSEGRLKAMLEQAEQKRGEELRIRFALPTAAGTLLALLLI